jgi:hypothetical protein
MADKAIYAPDEESQRKYQEALDRVMQSLDARKNRLFDPTLLAMAEGFLSPTRTGSFGESLGIAAGKLRGAEEAEFKREQELAQAQLGLAQQGMQLERQKQMSRAYQQAMGARPSAGGPPAGGAPSASTGGADGPMGRQVMEPMPLSMTKDEFLSAAQLEGKPFGQAMKEWDEYSATALKFSDTGVVNRATGRRMAFIPDVAPVSISLRTIPGAGTINIPGDQAKEHMRLVNEAMNSGNPAPLRQFEASLVRTFHEESPKPAQQGVGAPPAGQQVSPQAPQQAPQQGLGRILTPAELEIQAAEEKEYALGRAKTAVEKENQVKTTTATARSMLFNANRVQQLVSESPQGFGIFSRPGIASAFGNMINEGIKAGTTSVNLGGFENSVRQLMPNMSQRDLDNVSKTGGALAEMELAYTILYLQKQGQVTEGERAIVRNIPGSISQSPGVLMQKAKLIAMRAQHDINVGEAWKRFKSQNPRSNFNQFEESPTYEKLVKDYDQDLAKAFSVNPPAQQPGAAPASKPKFIIRPVGGQ